MLRIIAIVALCLTLAGCPTTGWTPEDCRQDVELAQLIAQRITRLVDQGETVSEADWDRYAAVVMLLARGGCEYVPEEWAQGVE